MSTASASAAAGGRDPLNPDQMIYDMTDALANSVIVSKEDRLERGEQLSFFIQQFYDTKPPRSGRLSCRLALASLLDRVCTRDAYNSGSVPKPIKRYESLVDAPPEEWTRFSKGLKMLKRDLSKVDADNVFLQVDDDDEEAESTPVETLAGVIFDRKYEEIMAYIKFHKSLCKIRNQIEAQGAVAKEDVVDFDNFLTNELDANSKEIAARDLLRKLLVNPGVPGKVSLKDPTEVRKMIKEGKEFDLARFQGKVGRLLVKWNSQVLTEPTLARLGYLGSAVPAARAAPPGDGVGEAKGKDEELPADVSHQSKMIRGKKDKENKPPVQVDARDVPEASALARARDTLRDEVVDPLEAIRRIAATAVAMVPGAAYRQRKSEGTPKLYQKKKTAKALVWGDSSDDEMEEADGRTLGEVPTRAVLRVPKPVQRERSPVRSMKYRSLGPGQKRRKFTDEEKAAIKLGVEQFGTGRWVELKDFYSDVLGGRTNVQIKDCYRTMRKHGEIG